MAKKILLIDDDRMVAKSLGRLLETQNFHVFVAQSGKEAIEIIAKVDFDLIISDIKMPNLNGVETIDRIKQYLKKEGKKYPAIIFITGYPNDSIIDDAKKLNTAEFIYKPFDRDEFLKSVINSIKGK